MLSEWTASVSACGSRQGELNESFKLIREPIQWFANWFDKAFKQNRLKEWIILEWASFIAQRKVDGAFGIN